MALTFTHTFNGKTTIVGQDFDDNFGEITTKFNQGIENADIAADAAIDATKLGQNKFHVLVTFKVRDTDLASGWPASGVLDIQPIAGLAGTWNVDSIEWACTDTGAANCTFDIQTATLSTGSVSTVTDLTGDITISNGAGADDTDYNAVTPLVSTVTVGSNECLVLQATAAGSATTLTTAPSVFAATVRLSRVITV
jgi:hypothetical protein